MILDQPWQIELYRLQAMKYALRLEIRTGMTHSRGSVRDAVNATLIRNGHLTGKPHRTKAAALEDLEAYIAKKEHDAGVIRP